MTRLASWSLLMILAAAFGLVVYHALRTRVDAGKDMPEYSVYSEEPNGLAPAVRFLRVGGWEMDSLHRELGIALNHDARAAREETLNGVEVSEVGGYTDGIDRMI